MANTHADPGWRPWGPATLARIAPAALLLALGLAPAGGGAVRAAEAARALPGCSNGNICFTADDTEYRRNRVVLHNIVIYQGGSVLRIQAQSAEASSLDFTDSTWTLDGAVQVRTTQGQLAADHATVRFAASRLGSALATGSPASFAQHAPADDPTRAARGHALNIDYDPVAGEVRLQGEAYLTDGCNETSTERIVYDFAQQRVRAQGTTGGGGRVQGTIRPACRPAGPATAPP
jgi:lipopolysaccharide transport protein LptA